jgi:glyoxylase I family protein
MVVYWAIGLGLSYRGETETYMMRRALSHLDLIITDPERSVPFYDAVLSLLGYRRVSVDGDTTVAACWSIEDAHQSVFSIALEPARGRGKRRKYNRYAPGLHHVAFHVDSRADVDRLYAQLVDIGAADPGVSCGVHLYTRLLCHVLSRSRWNRSGVRL